MVHYDNCFDSYHNEPLSCMGAKASQPTHFLKVQLTGVRLSEIYCIVTIVVPRMDEFVPTYNIVSTMNNNFSMHINREVTTLFYTHCNSIESIPFLIHNTYNNILYQAFR